MQFWLLLARKLELDFCKKKAFVEAHFSEH